MRAYSFRWKQTHSSHPDVSTGSYGTCKQMLPSFTTSISLHKTGNFQQSKPSFTAPFLFNSSTTAFINNLFTNLVFFSPHHKRSQYLALYCKRITYPYPISWWLGRALRNWNRSKEMSSNMCQQLLRLVNFMATKYIYEIPFYSCSLDLTITPESTVQYKHYVSEPVCNTGRGLPASEQFNWCAFLLWN